MPRPRMHSLEEVLKFTVKDIQGPNLVEVKVRGWLKLTSEQREQCILKLRDLVRQRDEITKSNAVDANELANKLNQVERSRSSTPDLPPYDPNAPEFLERNLRREKESHDALVGDNGRPCYPIELEFEVFGNLGQYKGIIEYWQENDGDRRSRLMFTRQLRRWKEFRQYQQKNRRYFVSRNRFPEFQQSVLERRRRHGLNGDVQLLENQDKQSKLDDWMEYQDYELLMYERLEKDLTETQARLVSRRKALAETGLSAFEEFQELEFGHYYGLAVKHSSEEGKAKKKENLAERNLRLAEQRLKTAESDGLGERLGRVAWEGLFLKEVESAKMRVDDLQRLYEDAKRETQPFHNWWKAKRKEWAEERLKNPEKVEDRSEVESAEFQDRMKQYKELQQKDHEAKMNHFQGEEEVDFAEEGLNAARLDDIGEIIERAALIKVVQEEVRSAKTQFEEARESREKIELQGKVLGALNWIPCVKGKIKRHIVLLEWIEQQRREIATSYASTENESSQSQPKETSSRELRKRSIAQPSRLSKPPKANGHERKQPTKRSILSPVNPTKVSKAPGKSRISHQKMSIPRDISSAAEKTTTNSSIPKHRRKQVSKVKDSVPSSLRPIHSSRVSKPGKTRPAALRIDDTKLSSAIGPHRLKGKDNLGMSLAAATDKKTSKPSAKSSLRRSTRRSKKA